MQMTSQKAFHLCHVMTTAIFHHCSQSGWQWQMKYVSGSVQTPADEVADAVKAHRYKIYLKPSMVLISRNILCSVLHYSKDGIYFWVRRRGMFDQFWHKSSVSNQQSVHLPTFPCSTVMFRVWTQFKAGKYVLCCIYEVVRQSTLSHAGLDKCIRQPLNTRLKCPKGPNW